MTIDNLYANIKFETVLYYLKENGFSSLADLGSLDFDMLYFIPGIDESVIYEAMRLYEQVKDANTDNNSKSIVLAPKNAVYTDMTDIIDVEQIIDEGSDDKNQDVPDNISSCISLLSVLMDKVAAKVNLRKILQNSRTIINDEQYEFMSFLCDEIDDCMMSKQYTFKHEQLLKRTLIENVFAEVTINSGRRCGGLFIRHCIKNGFISLWDLQGFSFDSSEVKGMSEESMYACKRHFKNCVDSIIRGEIKLPIPLSPMELFIQKWNELNENQRISVVELMHGATLQSVGDKLNLSRERIRQIVAKANKKLENYALAIAEYLLTNDKNTFSREDIENLFEDSNATDGCLSALYQIKDFTYIPFTGKFYKDIPADWNNLLNILANNFIRDGIDYYANLEILEDKLQKIGLSCFDFYDFLSYLLANKYKLYGDYVVRGDQSYSLICCDAVKKYFSDGIKLDNNDANPDILKLRDIIIRKYGNYELPSNNRAITARMAPRLILCDRGKYCIPEHADYSLALMDEIVDYINSSSEISLYYSEIFDAFQGRLLMETNIDNYNFLHGVLKYLYRDDFQYDRDAIIKIGGQKVPLEDKISELICSAGGPVSKDFIQQKIPYANDTRLFNTVSRENDIIQWGYNQFNHMDNIIYSNEDKINLKHLLKKITNKNRGYCNEQKLYAEVQANHPEFLLKNKMTECLNLFYVVEHIFSTEFRFSRPHIVSSIFPNIELTNLSIAKFLIGNTDVFMYSDLLKLSKEYCWSECVISLVLISLEKEYIRLNENEYLKKSELEILPNTLCSIEETIATNMGDSNYVALFAAFNYDMYPNIGHVWNEFLLHSVINEYSKNYKILEPRTRDRRFKRGIIVKSDNPCINYEELVIEQMKNDGITNIHQDEFSRYLCKNGLLLTRNVPQELYQGCGLRLEEGYFVLSR